MKVNKELIKGSTVILILSLLEQKEMYGYEMIKEMDVKSNSIFIFKEGTLYPILHTLEDEKLLEAYWAEGEGNRKRKYYKITSKGILYLKDKKLEWTTFKNAVDKVIWEGFSWA